MTSFAWEYGISKVPRDGPHTRYVALLDILGFREHIRQNALSSVAQKLAIVDAALLQDVGAQPLRGVRRPTTQRGAELLASAMVVQKTAWCKTLRFSDTILIYTPAADATDFHRLLFATNRLIAALAQAGVPVRGAITRGPLLENVKSGIFVGTALVDAHELEQQQEWVGAAIHPSLIPLRPSLSFPELREMGELYRYEVPLKSGEVRPLYCLGWPGRLPDPSRALRALRTFNKTLNWGAKRKLDATRDFIESYTKAAEISTRRSEAPRRRAAKSARPGRKKES